MLRLSVLVCLSTLAAHTAASAASFDCRTATTPREQAVCYDTNLSEADTKLNDVYASALTRLSDESGKLLRDSQRGWLHFLDEACPVEALKDEEARTQAVFCLTREYSRRIADLEQVGIRKGPFLFSRIDHYSVTRLSSKTTEHDTGLAIHYAANPQIDRPITPVTVRWNQLNTRTAQSSSCDSGDGDTSLDYQIGLVNARLISITWGMWDYCHGTPHGFGYRVAETLMLSPSPHPFRPKDLFRMDRQWGKRLSNLVLVAVKKAALEGPEQHATIDNLGAGVVAHAACDPKRWSLREAGLGIVFDSDELGLGYAFAPDITVPWSALRDVMVPDPPVL